MTFSPLELLLPRGRVEHVLVIGEGSAGPLLPAGADRGARAADLVLLVPRVHELRGREWLGQAALRAAEELAPGGAVYAIVPRGHRRRTRALLREAGLLVEWSFGHIPNTRRLRYLVPLEAPTWRYAFGQLISSHPLARRLLGSLPMPLVGVLLPGVGILARRADAASASDWVRRLVGGEAPPGPAIVGSGRRGGHGSSTIHFFAPREPAPWAVAKVRAGQSREAGTLPRLGPAAAAAGARVPRLLAASHGDAVSVAVESIVAGTPAARALGRSPERLPAIAESIVDWLARWNRLSGSRARLDAAFLEQHVLLPAAAVQPHLPDAGPYVQALRGLCAALEGHETQLVAAHNDLTMWNVVLGEDGHLGVLDWETAEECALPLVDVFYALVDAVAASRRYASRREAHEACFGEGGSRNGWAARLCERVAAAAGADERLLELAYHACWLHHARNELAGGTAGEFVQIAQTLAARSAVRAS